MAEYIEREATLHRMKVDIRPPFAVVADMPAADVAPVVHGRWIFGTANHREWMKCSECLVSQTPTGVFTYCPNCGARMDGGTGNE